MSAINVVTVTIGRNVPATPPEWIAQPMDNLSWQEFQNAVASALWTTSSTNGEAWEERHYGTAVWDGVTEESAKITLLNASFTHVVALRQRLETIRGMYTQDAIALSVGTSDLITRPSK